MKKSKTNFVEPENGLKYSQRSCVPSYLCIPGVYTKNGTYGTARVTTKCCKTDLCISIHFMIFSTLGGASSVRVAPVSTSVLEAATEPTFTSMPATSKSNIFKVASVFNLVFALSTLNYFVFKFFYF